MINQQSFQKKTYRENKQIKSVAVPRLYIGDEKDDLLSSSPKQDYYSIHLLPVVEVEMKHQQISVKRTQ